MKNREGAHVYRWISLVIVLAIVAVVLLGANLVDTTAQSTVPTWTFTPLPPDPPTDTPVPPTATPLPPTDTPVPPTEPPVLGRVQVSDAIVALGSSVTISVSLSAPDLAGLTATWLWGDDTASTCGVDPSCVIHPGDGISITVAASHVYAQPGVYSPQVTATDLSGQFDTARYEYVVVYDPDAGFVSGGGWIYSAPGAYRPDPDAEGRATFGFLSKYKKGAARPDGNTQFQFHTAGLTFHSSSYEWLVVTGSDYAMLKGAGAINSVGGYRFMLWAGDGNPDTFRIRIWWEDDQAVEHEVYDNGLDQEIGGGAIVVHTK